MPRSFTQESISVSLRNVYLMFRKTMSWVDQYSICGESIGGGGGGQGYILLELFLVCAFECWLDPLDWAQKRG